MFGRVRLRYERINKKIGYLKTLKFLNAAQKKSFIDLALKGRIEEEVAITGGCEYPDKTFFIIRRDGIEAGLFSLYITTVGWINYALEKGYVPVVDMSIYRNNYLEKSKRGKDNSWEYYFEQPMGYGINEAYKGKSIILSSLKFTENRPDESMECFLNKNGRLDYWKKIADGYVHIKQNIIEDMQAEYNQLLCGRTRILGVLARGTDYPALRPHNHPIMPTVEELITDSKDLIEKYQCDGIFLATEDKSILGRFKEEFGDMVMTNKREMVDYNGGYICQKHAPRENGVYLGGREYLASIWMLSKSMCLLCGRTSGAIAMVLMSQNEYCYSKFYNLGYYE